MAKTAKPTRLGFLKWMKEAGHAVEVLDVISLGLYFRQYVRLLNNKQQ